MPEKLSLFLKSSLLLVLLVSCGTDSLPDLEQLSHGRKIPNIEQYPSGYWYFKTLQNPQLTLNQKISYLSREGANPHSSWQDHAVMQGVQWLKAEGDWPGMEAFMEPLVYQKGVRDNWIYAYAQSLYWQDRRGQSLGLWEKIDPENLEGFAQWEYFLLTGVSRWEAQGDLLPREISRLLTTTPVTSLDLRLESYLQLYPEKEAQFSQSLLELRQFRLALARNDLNSVESYLDSPGMVPRVLYEDLYDYFRNRGYLTRGSRWFDQQENGVGAFYSGLLLRRLEKFRESHSRILQALKEETPIPERRLNWYLIETAFRFDPDQAVELLGQSALSWHQDEYYDDLFEAIRLEAVNTRRGDTLLELWPYVSVYGSDKTRSAYAYTLGRMIQEGWAESPLLPETFFEQAHQAYPWGYFGILGFHRLDREYTPVEELTKEEAPSPQVYEDPYWEPYLWYDGGVTGAQRIIQEEPYLSAPLLRRWADTLLAEGEPLLSIRLMNHFWGLGHPVSLEDYRRFYPRPYEKEMTRVVKKERLEPAVFWGLVREESHFEEEIGSHAGAVGLSQLMPATAAEEARRLKLGEYDLRNAEDNLTIGAYYFRRLRDRTSSYSHALMAYNAGLTRLRRWERAYGAYPMDLFAEAIPYDETRNYNKKVLVSAVYYGLLYYNQSSQEVVDRFF